MELFVRSLPPPPSFFFPDLQAYTFKEGLFGFFSWIFLSPFWILFLGYGCEITRYLGTYSYFLGTFTYLRSPKSLYPPFHEIPKSL